MARKGQWPPARGRVRSSTNQIATVVFDGIPITGPVYVDAVGTPYVEGRTPGGQLVRVAITAPEETEGA